MPDLNFDANKVEPVGSFEVMPVGDYLVAITASEMRDTKPKPNKIPGKYLHLTLDVLDGPFKGRKVFDMLNLVNANKTTEEIAQKQLSSICRVTGVMQPKKSEELHGKPFMVKLKIQKGDGGYEDSNRVSEYKFANGKSIKDAGAAGVSGAAVAGSPATVTPSTTQKMPWE
jgi:hypothetical protein